MVSEMDLTEVKRWLSMAKVTGHGDLCEIEAQRKLLSLLIRGKEPRNIVKELVGSEVFLEDSGE